MKAISLFSGAGGFELGLQRAGIETILQAESDPWCLTVLERHWPDVERVTDVRRLRVGEPTGRSAADALRPIIADWGRQAGTGISSDPVHQWAGRPERDRGRDELRIGQRSATVDLVYGGWPCQDLSVAGKRAGLRGDRSGLFYEFARVVRDVRPRWIAAENVPGLLSSPPDAPGVDFGIVLRTLVDLGYGMAWRILDGRWFGVPQRRRRPILVGCFGDAHRAAQVLAVCESCCGHPQTRSEAGENIAPTLDDGARDTSVELPLVAANLRSRSARGNVHMPGRGGEDDDNLIIGSRVSPDAMRPLTARSTGYRMDYESENFVVANGLRASDGHHGHSSPRGDGGDNLVAFDWQASDGGTDESFNGKPRKYIVRAGDYAGVSATRHDAVAGAMGVRRLTPLECERLMGWPDEHTRWTVDGNEIPDSHRYRMCGNGVIAPLAEWLGHRLIRADSFVQVAA